ncbi:hypothetical protein D3C87_161950 [compost metagenome]
MKKAILGLAMAAIMGVTAVPQQSQAFGIINIIATGRLDFVGHPSSYNDILATTVCILLLPFCILQDGTQAQDVMTAENLLANGYTATEAQEILAGHREVSSSVAAQGANANVDAIVKEVAAKNATYGAFATSF